jgi:hypothetical protein
VDIKYTLTKLGFEGLVRIIPTNSENTLVPSKGLKSGDKSGLNVL